MGCNCKGKNEFEIINDTTPIGKRIVNYTLKTLAFLFMVALLPIINLFIIWFMFKTLVLSRNVDIRPLLLAIGNKFKETDNDDDDDYDTLTEDDVVMVGVDEITHKSK
jgi:hypothetical protein